MMTRDKPMKKNTSMMVLTLANSIDINQEKYIMFFLSSVMMTIGYGYHMDRCFSTATRKTQLKMTIK